jgi:phospholipid-translocating ATPase
VDEFEGYVSLSPLRNVSGLIFVGRIFETHFKSSIVLVSFGITISGWWAWNIFLSAAYSPNATPYGVKNGFLHQYGRDWIWWLTLILQVTILMIAYIAIRVGKRYLSRPRFFASPRSQVVNLRAGDCEVDIEHWQELEHDALVRGKLASLAKQGMRQTY